MKIFVKTLKGTHFEIDVNSEDTIADVKKNIETSQGHNVYPAEQQMLIHQGKIMKDATTLAENNVVENNFLVVMLSKTKASPSGSLSSNVSSTVTQAPTTTSVTPPAASQAPTTRSLPPPATPIQSAPVPPVATDTARPPPATPVQSAPAPAVAMGTARVDADPYGHAASNLVAGSKFEESVQHILDIGGGNWDRDTVIRALRAAYNNPERAIEYLYSGIPEQELARITPPSQPVNPPQGPQQRQPAAATGGPNANPLDLFPQGLPSMGSNTGAGNLDFLRNNPQFRALQAMVQSNPQILQPMLQELGKQNPQLMRMIQEHQADFVRLLNEPSEGAEGNLLSQLASAMPQAVQVTPEEREAIERLEAMGFDRALVLEVFFACNKNEELAANYLLDHMHEFED